MNENSKTSDNFKNTLHNPFATAESYYDSPKTNPSQVYKNSRTGKVRTFSVFEPRMRLTFFDDDLLSKGASTESFEFPKKDESPFSKSGTPVQVGSVDTSIVPIEAAPSTESLENENITKDRYRVYRRASMDDSNLMPKKFYIADIDSTLNELLQTEDTDHNYQITIEDTGPKVINLGTANSDGYKQYAIRGTYMLSNLLQELTIAKRFGKNRMILDEDRLNENPVHRLKRLISTQFWRSLTRELTNENIEQMSRDTKIAEETIDDNGNHIVVKESHRIYIPHDRLDIYDYYMESKKYFPDLDVCYLPEQIDAKFIRSINKRPGLLALAMNPDPKNPSKLVGQPYVVPGGRFNELYGWDSYMETIGLLTDVTKGNQEHLRLARGMTENFIFEIKYYGKILNANRSYYLGRSQPPFLTDMALRVFNKTMEVPPETEEENIDFLKRSILAAIKEYKTIWCAKPRLDEESGLSCYHPEGIGIPPETEATHFDALLLPYAKKYNVTQKEFIEMYNTDRISEPELDDYFLHDRAVRESGHDTSYRLEGKCAHLATVDLNSLLYKYETDIASVIEKYFGGELIHPELKTVEKSSDWTQRATKRQELISKYLWNEKDSIFYDYNIKTKSQTGYESATSFWPLWSEVATPEQAEKLVENSLSKFEEYGGLVSGTLKSRGDINILRPSRQWDYPYGWAPQQILAWIGLSNYGYEGIARRLAYRWLYLMIQSFVDYNGIVVEKYNVVKGAVAHKVDAEYGNQGSDFKGVATEGFGWVNASFLFGLTYMNLHAIRCLGTLTPPDIFLANIHPTQKDYYN